MHPDDSRFVQQAFLVNMLVSVDHDLRFCSLDIGVQSLKAMVHLILPIMNSPWGIVRQKDLDGREGRKGPLNFRLVVKKVPAGFLPP
jgi:hypothetical protein